jgi:predicted regulator of Ras-like GTPase activity (Roadblock/LC7/MglB family)
MKDTWSLLENDFRTVERTLLELLERTQAQAAHLVDRGGRIVMSVGPDVEYDLNSFASLAAADLAANDELMRLFGGTQVDGVACLGTHRSMASSLVADRLVLCVVFDRHSTLGLVRLRMRRATEKLGPVFRGLFAKLGVAAGPVVLPAEMSAPRVTAAAAHPTAVRGRRATRRPHASPVPATVPVAVPAPEAAAVPEPEPQAVGAPAGVPAGFGAEAAAALDDLLGGDSI